MKRFKGRFFLPYRPTYSDVHSSASSYFPASCSSSSSSSYLLVSVILNLVLRAEPVLAPDLLVLTRVLNLALFSSAFSLFYLSFSFIHKLKLRRTQYDYI